MCKREFVFFSFSFCAHYIFPPTAYVFIGDLYRLMGATLNNRLLIVFLRPCFTVFLSNPLSNDGVAYALRYSHARGGV